MATIRKHITRDIATIDASAPCREAAKLMADRRIGSVGVAVDGRIIGLATERDLVVTVLARGGDGSLAVREAVRKLPRVEPSASETECAELMKEHFTRHLLVAELGEVIGVVSMRDIIQVMLDEKSYVIEQLHEYIGKS
ncbi:MAG: CBS domain-containing protein [Anaeromyxobacter sp.]|nr:CBS domain-containing protein [Anaeromyxobacter sp.]MBL0274623.1 CBS domain-containing protein [Anaeromyxobacter sp.]